MTVNPNGVNSITENNNTEDTPTVVTEKAVLHTAYTALSNYQIDEDQLWQLLADLGIGTRDHQLSDVRKVVEEAAVRYAWSPYGVQSTLDSIVAYDKPATTETPEETTESE